MNIVITMAGLGSRFIKVGYKMPKYQINAHGNSLFHWSMLSLEDFFESTKGPNLFVFIVRKEDNACEFIARECRQLGIKDYKIIEINALTDGQATTALLAKSVWQSSAPLLIYNIDTYVEAGQLRAHDLKGDGFIPCFYGEGDHWSFVRLDNKGRAVEVREKVRISDHCTLGAYYFKTAQLYETLYNAYYSDNSNIEKNEKYVAPLYNFMIGKGHEVYINHVEPNKIHVLGTPEELDLFISKPIT